MPKIGNKNNNNTSVPTLAEYISTQIAGKRAAALDKSRNRTSVRVPMISNYETEEHWKHRLNTTIQNAEELLSRLMASGENGDYAKAKQQELDALLEELDKGYPKLISGANCMYNAGDCYGLNIPGNETFAAKHKELGFQKTPKGSMEPGDLVQDVRMGYPTHAMIYDSKDDENNLLFNYARGYNSTSVEENYVKQGKYPLPIKDYDVYKYVGTPADSTQWINEYKQRYGNGMRCGGRRKAQLGLDIREGGIAIPIANNMYYMDGRSHDNGGIAIGPNNKNGLEVEGGEVVKVGKNDVKVFSSVPLLRGVSPAQLVMGGANPDTVFKAQEEFKDRNRINDDGTRYEVGGEKIYTPSKSIQRQIQETGKITIGGAPTIGGLRTFGYLRSLANTRKYGAKGSLIFRAGKELIKRGTQKLVDSGKISKEIAQIPRSIYGQFIGAYGQNLSKTIGLINNNMEQKKAGGIYIKPSKRGTFTAAAKKHDMGVQEFASKVLANKEDYSPAMVKKANFARNASRWKKEYGGDSNYYSIMEKVAKDNYKQWGFNNEDEALMHALNDNTYNYLGYYNKYPNSTANADTHWTDEFKTVYHPTFSIESVYSGNKSIYNPLGLKGGYWDGDNFVPAKWQKNKKEFGGNMIYEINGNVRNGLSLRPKAKYGLATKYLKKKDNDNVNKDNKKTSNSKKANYNFNDGAKIALGTVGGLGVAGVTSYGLTKLENYLNEVTKPSLEISQKALDEYNKKYVRKTQGKTNKGFTPRNPLKSSNNIQYQRLDINEHNIGLYDSKDPIVRATIKARGLNPDRVSANGSFVRRNSNLTEVEQRKLDKVYNKAVGNKEPKSGFGAKPADKVITAEYPNTSISSKPTNVVGKTYDPTVEFRQANKPKPVVNTGLNNYLRKLGKGVKGLGVVGSLLDIYNNLFPSEEAELLEDLRVRMKEQSTPGVRMYKYGGRIKAKNGKFLKYKNGVFTDPETGEQFDVDPEVFKMYGNTKESGVIPISDYTKGTFNARPQYYAEKRLPIAGSQSIAEKFGLARSGWSYSDNPTFDYVPNINISIPTNYAKVVGDNTKKSTNSTARGEGTKSSKATTKSIEYPSVVRRDEYYSNNEPKGNSTPVDESYVARQSRGIQAVNEQSPSSTGGGTQSKDGRWVGQYKTTNVGDWIGLGSNLAGSVASYFMTKNAINKMPEPIKPIMAQAAKLKTRYNVEPQLTELREAEQMNRAAVRRNTQSSNTSLAREQRLMNEARGARNTLYGQKENIETQLINQDRLNRQSVMRDNIRAYNEYLNRVIATKMAQNEMRASNINNLISGLTGSVNSILGNIESRRATNNTLRAIAAANPNVDARLIGGFDYYIDPITKKKYNKNQQYVGTING